MMCTPAQIGSFFQKIEPLFWFIQLWLTINLMKPERFFGGSVKALNWLLKCQGFDVTLSPTEKAMKIWQRDLGIMFFLNLLIIILISLI